MDKHTLTQIALRECDPDIFDPYEVRDQEIQDREELEEFLRLNRKRPIRKFLLGTAAILSLCISFAYFILAIGGRSFYDILLMLTFAAVSYFLITLIK